MRNYLSQYIHRAKRSHSVLRSSLSKSKTDLIHRLHEVVENPKPETVTGVISEAISSSIWIGHASLDLAKKLNFLLDHEIYEKIDTKHKDIISKILQKKTLSEYSNEEIFQTIFNEVLYTHEIKDYHSKLKVAPTNITIALVDGVFNELFSGAAFERALSHLSIKYGIKYIVPKVHGVNGSKYNAEYLIEQLKNHVKDNPDEKIWLLAFSKGGLDSLHLFNNHKTFVNKHIVGLSTIATPILGTDHVESTLIKVIDRLQRISPIKPAHLLGLKHDIHLESFKNSLSGKHQNCWFKIHHKTLPARPFYTAVAFRSHWYQSHIWMMATKFVFRAKKENDGVVNVEAALYPKYFKRGKNLGTITGHHLVGARSTLFNQEAFVEALVIYAQVLKLI